MPDSHRNPFEGVTDFFSELSRMRQVGVQGREHGHEDRQRTHASAWVPATDIFARDDDLVIRIEVAGLRPEDVRHHVLPRRADRLGHAADRAGQRRPRQLLHPRALLRRLPAGHHAAGAAPTTARSTRSSTTGWWRSPCRAASAAASPSGSRSATRRPTRRRARWGDRALTGIRASTEARMRTSCPATATGRSSRAGRGRTSAPRPCRSPCSPSGRRPGRSTVALTALAICTLSCRIDIISSRW